MAFPMRLLPFVVLAGALALGCTREGPENKANDPAVSSPTGKDDKNSKYLTKDEKLKVLVAPPIQTAPPPPDKKR